ncbi:sensor histidine kinase [Caldimonas sp. KR1-144]|uniref:sensor histidine kinase n=1 Tax=Caldimonas sp. KR1-144 TaxID=3400911 RepID=UPI003C04124E
MSSLPSSSSAWRARAEQVFAASGRALRRYSDWLAQQTWKRFLLLALLALVAGGILHDLPPFTWRLSEDRTVVHPPRVPKPGSAGNKRVQIDDKKGITISDDSEPGRQVQIKIDEKGVHVYRGEAAQAMQRAASEAEAAEAAASQAASAAEAAAARGLPVPPMPPVPPVPPVEPDITVPLPKGADAGEIQRAIEEAKAEIEEAIADTKPQVTVVEGQTLGESMMSLLMLAIVASIIAKVMGKGRRKAEVQAKQATEMAESEALRRQVVEARMAAMQAQVEPHFLFNTLASIDHLIETDASRASKMQKNLIALLRASMPTMREANATGTKDLGRELSVIRPYLEILKVRMEDRLQFEIDIPEGLHSADFPPMMLQSLVENAIKHGLEPKAEGGRLLVKAEIQHGKLAVTVADTGLGFGKAATAGTGTGLANIRERLQLLYGGKAQLKITENQPQGTVVTIVVPYTMRNGDPNEEGAKHS